jgi:DNA-binding XRE family transcriptional regulator
MYSTLDKLYVIPYIFLAKGALVSELITHLRQHRARLDLTQEALARMVGVRRQTIIAIEKGKYVPSTLLSLRLARALSMTVDELFEIADESQTTEGHHED